MVKLDLRSRVLSAISGEIAQISGQGVLVQSGTGVIIQSGAGVIAMTSMSGNIVQISGQTIITQSGTGVIIQSGAGVIISGQAVTVSGNFVTITGAVSIISGSGVIIQSGVGVVIQSGHGVLISGQIVGANIISGQFTIDASALSNVAAASGVTLKNIQGSGNQIIPMISMGLNMFTNPNAPKYIAHHLDSEGCQYVTTHSGEYVVISGTISVSVPSNILTGALLTVTGSAGGVVISSGITTSIVIGAKSTNAGDIYVGSSGNKPSSGTGFILSAGISVAMDLNNLNIPYVCASTSGDVVSYMGVV